MGRASRDKKMRRGSSVPSGVIPDDCVLLPRHKQQAMLALCEQFGRLLAMVQQQMTKIEQLARDPQSFGLMKAPPPTRDEVIALAATYGIPPGHVPAALPEGRAPRGFDRLAEMATDAAGTLRDACPKFESALAQMRTAIEHLDRVYVQPPDGTVM